MSINKLFSHTEPHNWTDLVVLAVRFLNGRASLTKIELTIAKLFVLDGWILPEDYRSRVRGILRKSDRFVQDGPRTFRFAN